MSDEEFDIVSESAIGPTGSSVGSVQVGSRVSGAASGAINYFFPVHVEVNSQSADLDVDAIAGRALELLSDSLASDP